MPPFKDEHVLIISPGSRFTQAQLGLPETFTPPRWNFPSRMFPGDKEGEWEPVRVRSKPTIANTNVNTTTTTDSTSSASLHNGAVNGTTNGTINAANSTDAEAEAINGNPQSTTAPAPVSEDTSDIAMTGIETNGQPNGATSTDPAQTTTMEEYEDDPFSIEGSVCPLVGGRIENWPCFFALLSHIYKFISPPFHMPVLVVAQPCWTSRDKEWITQYFFENWKIPALCVMDSALAAAYAFGVQTATVVDVGQDKCDVTAIHEFVINEIGRGVAIAGCGGDAMTQRLLRLLKSRKSQANDGVTWEMAEQLKCSPICEILPLDQHLPSPFDEAVGESPAVSIGIENPAAAMSTGATDSGPNATHVDGQALGFAPRGPGAGTEVGEEGEDDDEGVLDVAAIVAQSNAAEVLAKREKEKAEKVAAKKGGQAEPPRPVRLRNSEKEKAVFTFEETVPYEPQESSSSGRRKRKRDVEVGVERFMAATPTKGETDGIIDRIAAAIHSTIMAVPDIPARAHLWDNLIILGNGTRVRGFKDALIATLAARYTLSPSTATIFTSELPSNFSTPAPTNGTNTPVPGQQHSAGIPHPAGPGHGVNPLLVAATKNMMQPGGVGTGIMPGSAPGTGAGTPSTHLSVPGQFDPMAVFHQHYRGFTQTPTAMRTVKPPDYFPEWKDPSVSGMEDAAFLGAQVVAKVVFIVDQGMTRGFLTRTEYNEGGPEAIHGCAM